MEKPKGKFKCRACNSIWDGSQLVLDPMSTAVKWTCADYFCGGTCDPEYTLADYTKDHEEESKNMAQAMRNQHEAEETMIAAGIAERLASGRVVAKEK